MTSSSPTILEAIAASLRQTAKSYFPGVEEAPACVLWTDPESVWQPVIPQMAELLPELLILGECQPEKRQGPVRWLKTALAGKVPSLDLPNDVPPILYLPGVARHQLRNADQCEWDIQPLVELLYRGVAWSHKNGRDWSVEAFFVAEDGLGLDLAQDEKTRLSLRSALGAIAQTPVSRLQGKRLEAGDFDSLVIGDTPRDLLTWIGYGDAVKTEWTDERWHAFRSRVRDEFDFDPEKEAPLYAAERLGLREQTAWKSLWERFCEAPAIYAGVRDRLDQAQPSGLLALDPEPWPGENFKREKSLADALAALEKLAPHDARQKLSELEKEHAPRRQWVWARLGEAPLAVALEFLHQLGEATRSVPSFSKLDEFSAWYAEIGWKADIAALDALRAAGDHAAPVRRAIRSVYAPWLEEVACHFQKLASDGLPKSNGVTAAEGECLLFVDGLRLDLARRLAAQLEERSLTVDFQTRYAALPTVTATAKPAVSPVSGELAGAAIPASFAPNGPDGKELTHQRFTKLLKEQGIQNVEEGSPSPAGPDSRGWCETGRIDSRGHDLGAELAGHLPSELNRVITLAERLLGAGWKSVKIVTDHGWLLMPGGLEKYDLPGYLVESRWSRCASIKGQSVPNAPVVPWHWNGQEHVAVAPGAKSFLGGLEYSHGGVSPQECVLPVISVIPQAGASANGVPTISSIRWKRLRCSVEIANARHGLRVDARRQGSDAKSTICASLKDVETDGQASLLVTDETLEGKTITIVLLSESNEPIAKADTIVGS
jgi:hypothetical protein